MSGGRRGGGGTPHLGSNSGSVWVEKNSKESGKSDRKKQRAPCNSSNAAPAPATARQDCNGSLRSSGNSRVRPSDGRLARRNPRPLPQNKYAERELQASGPFVTASVAHSSSVSESNKDDVLSSGCDPEMGADKDENAYSDDSDAFMSEGTSDDSDSEATEKSFEDRKVQKLFKRFFEDLETLSVEQLNEQTMEWHCPACKNVRGGVSWYKGLQPLVTHARTKGSKRVKLHRDFAALLEEELYRRGAKMAPSGEIFGIWKGLRESTDREIVWPPVVIIMNTRLEKEEDGKWKGMGSQELLGYFGEYHANKASHAYGPDGHRGMSALIFEGLAVAYIEAERLHKHFIDQSKDRHAWLNRGVQHLSLTGGEKQLYGFLAEEKDMEMFNKHHHGKSYLKYEMKSYNEMVVTRLKQMSEDNQQLNFFKNEMVKTKQHSKAVEEALDVKTQKLQDTIEDNIIFRRKAKEMLLEYEEQLKFQEKFYHEQIERIHKAVEEKESEFEKLLQDERAKARQYDVDSGTTEDCRLRKEKIQRFIDCQVKDLEEFEGERDELLKMYEEKVLKHKTEYMAKEVELEKELDAALTSLMEKHKPDSFQSSSSPCSEDS